MFLSLNLLNPMGDGTTVNGDTLEPVSETISLTGDPVRGAGWYGPTTGLHTVAISVLNFRGRISVQAALTTTPQDADWFSVLPNGEQYIEYPRVGYVAKAPTMWETSIMGFNFRSNVVWVRASVDRSYFIPQFATPAYISTFGVVKYILLNY